ncbi:hypothetical protein F0562_019429 [Nyssa sinensis]|uniref:Uncharacterized protein n=1 Tax=Nyssa sinensis TaxID=561372 RepID=A0A5J5BNL5_9ASTE|nr:hypothetical protein F0562_019429 [Nyssa sinensis]
MSHPSSLPESSSDHDGIFEVKLHQGEGQESRSYAVATKYVKELKLSKLANYFNNIGDQNLQSIPREILQGMDVVIKQNPSRPRHSHSPVTGPVQILQGSYIKASRVIRQILKPTQQGLALCLDYSILTSIHRPVTVKICRSSYSRIWQKRLHRFGDVAQNFGMRVSEYMTEVEARVLHAPTLKLKLSGILLVDAKAVERWALLDFTSPNMVLDVDYFVWMLRERCGRLGMPMEVPLFCRSTQMSLFGDVDQLCLLLESVVEKVGSNLQIIVCAMTNKHRGYKYLKWISDTEIGIVTQCYLSTNANRSPNKKNAHYFDNLALKINAKLQGSNIKLNE